MGSLSARQHEPASLHHESRGWNRWMVWHQLKQPCALHKALTLPSSLLSATPSQTWSQHSLHDLQGSCSTNLCTQGHDGILAKSCYTSKDSWASQSSLHMSPSHNDRRYPSSYHTAPFLAHTHQLTSSHNMPPSPSPPLMGPHTTHLPPRPSPIQPPPSNP